MSGLKDRDIKIDLGAVQETLVLPLWARAKEAEKKNPIVYDPYARDIIARIDYDFSKIESRYMKNHQLVWAVRAYNFDACVRKFLEHNSEAVVVNIGAGLDTTFQRVDNGSVLWVNIDLPDVVTLRRNLILDSDREMTIAKSVFDFTWMDDISQQKTERSLLFMAAGVLCYFDPSRVETLFRKLAHVYPSAQLVFDSFPRFTTWAWNTGVRMGKAHFSAIMKWHLKRASYLKKWIDTIEIVEEYPLFAKVKFRDDWDKKVIRGMRVTNFLRLSNMIHVRF